MKNITKGAVYFAIASAILFTGCKKEFLGDPKPGDSIGAPDVFATDAGVRAFLTGTYRNLRTQWGTSTDAWGIVSVNLAREVKGLDVGLPSANWYNFDYLHDNREPTFRRVSFTWNFFYELINGANNLIAGVEASNLSATSKAQFLAEGRALRAWCYFELVREFAHAYGENPNAVGIPIYTVPTTPETTGNKRSSIAEVYALIVSDLEFAATNSATTRSLKDVINKDVVNGLLARVYLEMGDNASLAKAISAAQAARTSFPLNAAQLTPAMTTDFASKSEVIWGFPQAADQSIFYGSPSAFFGLSGTGYFNFFVDPNFVAKFTATDVRKAKFVTAGTGAAAFRTTKFGLTTSFTDFIVMMRSPEMYLIEAEAKARLNDASANAVLYQVQLNRDPSAVISVNTGAALIDEILLEKRKELFGEIGIGFLDIKRTQKPLVRSDGHIVNGRINLPANSNTFTLKLPQTEIDANQALTEADQNN